MDPSLSILAQSVVIYKPNDFCWWHKNIPDIGHRLIIVWQLDQMFEKKIVMMRSKTSFYLKKRTDINLCQSLAKANK